MSSEIEIRSEVLRRLRNIPAGGGDGQPPHGIVHAEDFSAILRSLGLEFGHPVVDKIMISCQMDDGGWVDYRKFASEVDAVQGSGYGEPQRRSNASQGNGNNNINGTSMGQEKIVHYSLPAPPTPGTPASRNNSRAIQMENSGQTQREAMADPVPRQQQQRQRQPPPQQQQRQPSDAQSITQHQEQAPPAPSTAATHIPPTRSDTNRSILNHGHANPFLKSPESAVKSQSARVRSLSSELASLFKTFDSGLCSVQVVRESLAQMGLEETPEVKKLLRQQPCEFSFTQLLQALCAKRVGTPIKAPAGALVRRSEGDIFGNEGLHMGEGASGVRRGAPKLGVTHSGLDVVTWRDEKSRVASATIGSDALNGIEHRGRGVFSSKDSSSNSVSDAMHRGSYALSSEATGAAWDTTSRRQASEAFPDMAVQGSASTLPGAPSARIKGRVYSAIRALDENTITEQEFVSRLLECGVEINHSIEHLIAKHRANGTAKFQDFVQVVQPYFTKIDREYSIQMAQQQQQRAGTRGGAGQRLPSNNRTKDEQEYYDAVSNQKPGATPTQGGPLATQHHGDILTWSSQPSGLEKRAQKLSGGRLLGMGKSRSPNRKHLQENLGSFTWESGTATESHRARGSAAPNNNTVTSGNIISWHEEDHQAATQAAWSPASLGSLSGGQGRLHYSMAKKLYGGSTPYGTDVDLGEGLDKTYGHGRQARKGLVRSRGRETTGAWLTQPPAAQQQTNRVPSYGSTRAPFGTDVDVRPGKNIGFAGNRS